MTIKELSQLTGKSERTILSYKNGNKLRTGKPVFDATDWSYEVVNGRNRINFKESCLEKIKSFIFVSS